MYALCLMVPYQEKESRLVRGCRQVWVSLARKDYRDEMLEPLEGQIEDRLERTSYLETVLFDSRDSYRAELEALELTGFLKMPPLWRTFSQTACLSIWRLPPGKKKQMRHMCRNGPGSCWTN